MMIKDVFCNKKNFLQFLVNLINQISIEIELTLYFKLMLKFSFIL